MNIINIDGQDFVLISTKDFGVNGRIELKLRKPKGRKFFFAVVYEDGSISSAVQEP